MKNLLLRACMVALAFLAMPAFAQSTASSVQTPAGYAPMQAPCVEQANLTCKAVSATNPLPSSPVVAVASSTACTGTVTTSASTPTGCSTISGSAGSYVIGGFTPQIGYGIRVVLTGTWTGTVAVGTSGSACSTFNPLTVGGSTWGSFTGNANETVDVPATTVTGLVYCLQVTVSSGTLTYALRN